MILLSIFVWLWYTVCARVMTKGLILLLLLHSINRPSSFGLGLVDPSSSEGGFGIVHGRVLRLMEIGIWECIPRFLSSYINRQGPAIVQEKLIKNMGDILHHSMGQAYERATILCLKGEFVNGKKDANIKQEVIRCFEDGVLKRLEEDPTRDGRKVNG